MDVWEGESPTPCSHGVPHVVAEQDRERVEQLRRRGIAAVYGDASEPAVLIRAMS